MIEFRDVCAGCLKPLSFVIPLGSVCKIIASSGEEKSDFVNMALGMKKPDKGSVFILGKDIYSITEEEYIELFKSVGVVMERGGMISNLSVWENLALPAEYHQSQSMDRLEESIVEMFGRLGYQTGRLADLMRSMPTFVPAHEMALLSIARTLLLRPDHIIYNSSTDSLGHPVLDKITTTQMRFHNENENRTSMFITSNPASLRAVSADKTIYLNE